MNNQEEMTVIECRGLSKGFSSKAETLHVLSGLDLTVPKACSCAITGVSGSGKSTLLSILGGLDRADSGEVRVGKYRLDSMEERKLPEYRSKQVGFVFQFHYLLKDFTAVENVALPMYMAGVSRRHAWERAGHLLEKVGLADRMRHYPSELSGGERQRAAIARALANEPLVVLADEPTGNLDPAHAESIRDLLLSLPGISGTSVVLATHDSHLAEAATLRFVLSGGRLAAV